LSRAGIDFYCNVLGENHERLKPIPLRRDQAAFADYGAPGGGPTNTIELAAT
jgi:hypothetical protein